MHTVVGVRVRECGAKRLVDHLRVIDRLLQEPGRGALHTLELELGRVMTELALTAAYGKAGWQPGNA